ncbi:hypothetical protein GJ744_005997 [Endocarpon pusillum]|uniref:Uncharacterized protein n=1 Tax=Endocarpon pusillum TaxID=364733 RepID=A0A8H7A856_9EURO|nr:hypothetical protein GJ744_005997 [Endocarpon pusillum]
MLSNLRLSPSVHPLFAYHFLPFTTWPDPVTLASSLLHLSIHLRVYISWGRQLRPNYLIIDPSDAALATLTRRWLLVDRKTLQPSLKSTTMAVRARWYHFRTQMVTFGTLTYRTSQAICVPHRQSLCEELRELKSK